MASKDKVSFDVRGGGKPIPLKRIRTAKPMSSLAILKQLHSTNSATNND